MKNLLLLALALPLTACVVGDTGGQTPPGGDDDDNPPVDPPGTDGHITADTTLTGAQAITATTTIDPGVTVTVDAGTTIEMSSGTSLIVNGTLTVNGTQASKVIIKGAGAGLFTAIQVGTGGTLNMTYAEQTGGGIRTSAGATATITDSLMYGVSGDFLIMNGGTVTMSFSQLGAPAGTADTTHCNMHFGGSGNQINITNSNIVGQPYGLMFYGGTGAVFTNNNWTCGPGGCAAHIDVDAQPGVVGDFSNGFFEKGPPVAVGGSTITANNLATVLIPGIGVR
ncbi:MAG: hypothetical protein ABI867_01300 [Kofleriaceae bacterium]